MYIQLCDASVPDDVQLVPEGCVHDVHLVPDISIIFIFSSAMHLSPMMFNSSQEDVPNIYIQLCDASVPDDVQLVPGGCAKYVYSALRCICPR